MGRTSRSSQCSGLSDEESLLIKVVVDAGHVAANTTQNKETTRTAALAMLL